MTPVHMNYCNQYISSQVAESPCSGFTASCKSQSCCIFIGATPQSLAQIAALHPIFGLVILPKWRPRYMGFMQLDYPIAGYRAM